MLPSLGHRQGVVLPRRHATMPAKPGDRGRCRVGGRGAVAELPVAVGAPAQTAAVAASAEEWLSPPSRARRRGERRHGTVGCQADRGLRRRADRTRSLPRRRRRLRHDHGPGPAGRDVRGPASPLTCAGVLRGVVVPSPSWPLAFAPQVQTVPSLFATTTWVRPRATAADPGQDLRRDEPVGGVAERRAGRCGSHPTPRAVPSLFRAGGEVPARGRRDHAGERGHRSRLRLDEDVVPMPSWPEPLAPQLHTVRPSRSRRARGRRPAATRDDPRQAHSIGAGNGLRTARGAGPELPVGRSSPTTTRSRPGGPRARSAWPAETTPVVS